MTPHDPYDRSRIEAALAEIEALLDRLGAPWTLAGALAADKYRSEERLTTDGDLLADWRDGLIEGVEGLGFEYRVTEHNGEVDLVRTCGPDAAVDVIVATTDYQRLAIQRGLRRWLTVEDVLIHKMVAWRPKDRDDIASILSTGRLFDRAYVERWINEIGFEDRWEEAQTWA